MRVRGLASGRPSTRLSRNGLVRWAPPRPPPARDVQRALAGWSSRRTALGTARPTRLGTSGTALAARGRGRSRCRLRSTSDLLDLPSIGRAERSAAASGGGPGHPLQFESRAEPSFRPFSVHQFRTGRISIATAVHSALSVSRSLAICRDFVPVHERRW